MDTIAYNQSSTSFVGRDAVEVFRLAALASSLSLEMKGLRLSRHVSALAVAKQTTGLKTNNRAKQLERVLEMLDELKGKVEIVDARS
jgi:hypothetical protein